MKTFVTIGLLTAVAISFLAVVFILVGREPQTPVLPKQETKPQNQEKSPQKTLSQEKGTILPFPLTVPPEFRIGLFATNLGAVRDLVFSPNGTLLASVPEKGSIIALPDENHDGIADEAVTVIDGLTHPHGIAFYNGKLFVVSVTSVSRYSFDETTKKATKEKDLFSLPGGGGHTNYTLTFKPDGTMFVALGSTCNVCIEQNPWRGVVIVSDENGNTPRLFATGLRNAAFITFEESENKLWGTEMGRDWLGDNLPPDEINIIEQDSNYGWPYCYGDRVVDRNFTAKTTLQRCNQTQSPAFQLQAHSAPLGLTLVTPTNYPLAWQGDVIVAYHGSWNRTTPVGYKVVKIDREGESLTKEEDIITGFLVNGQKRGRPVDVLFDSQGNLYISDDGAGNVYIMYPKR